MNQHETLIQICQKKKTKLVFRKRQKKLNKSSKIVDFKTKTPISDLAQLTKTFSVILFFLVPRAKFEISEKTR